MISVPGSYTRLSYRVQSYRDHADCGLPFLFPSRGYSYPFAFSFAFSFPSLRAQPLSMQYDTGIISWVRCSLLVQQVSYRYSYDTYNKKQHDDTYPSLFVNIRNVLVLNVNTQSVLMLSEKPVPRGTQYRVACPDKEAWRRGQRANASPKEERNSTESHATLD